jgi:superfamily I DNA/RNA helicase
MRPDADVWGQQARFWSVEDLKAWVGGLPAKGILEHGKLKEIEQFSDKATDEDIADVMGSWFTAETIKHIVPKPDLAWYIGHMAKGSEVLRKYVMEVIYRHGVGALRKRPLVEVGTVHALKGREADTVVVSPDISLMAYQNARASEEVAEEMRRVYYVAISRARDSLLLAAPSSKTAVRW